MADNSTEFVFSAKDEVSPVLLGMIRALGQLDTKLGGTDKSVSKLEASMAKAATSFGAYNNAIKAGGTGTLAKDLAGASVAASGYQKTLQNLNLIETQSGQIRRANGKFAGADEIRQYTSATQALANIEVQANNKRAESASRFNQAQLANLKTMRATLPVGAQVAKSAEEGAKATLSWREAFKDFPPPSTRYALYDVSNSMAILGAAMLAGEVATFAFAASFERSFADVKRTVNDLNDSGLDYLQNQLVDLSKTIPVSFSELSRIASLGGQLGIAGTGIDEFTESIAKIATVSDLSVDQAATAFGRFKALLHVPDEQFSNLSSSILKVGVNSVATESQITNISVQISSMAAFAGYTADQVIGLSGALASIGAPPELSRGVVTRVFSNMSNAVADGGLKLQAFARVAGVTSQQFADSWGTPQFSNTFLKFLGGIQKSGDGAVTTLHALGITSVRDVPLLMRLAGAADASGKAGALLAQTLDDAKTGWEDNTELARQYNQIASTVVERLKVLVQNFQAFFAAVGTGALVVAKPLIDFLISLVGVLEDIASTPVGGAVFGITTAFLALNGVVALLTSGLARSVAGFLGVRQAWAGLTGIVTSLKAGFAAVAVGADAGAVANSRWAVTAGVAKTAALGLMATLGPLALVIGGLFIATSQADIDQWARGLQGIDTSAKGAAMRFLDADQAIGAFKNTIKGTKDLDLSDHGFFGFNDFNIAMNRSLPKGGFWLDIKTLDEDMARMVHEGHAEEAAKQYQSLQKQWKDAKGTSSGFRAAFVDTVNALKDFKPAANSADEAIKLIGEDADTGADKIQELGETLAKGALAFIDTGSLIKANQDQQKQAATDRADAEKKASEDSTAAWTDYYDGQKVNLATYLDGLRQSVEAQSKWKENLQGLSKRGVSDEILADLARLGPEGAPLVQALIDGTDVQLSEYKALMAKGGADSVEAFATNAAANQFLIQNALKSVGTNSQAALITALKSGMPIEQVMKQFNLDAAGNPVRVQANTDDAFDTTNRYIRWVAQQRTDLLVAVHASLYGDPTAVAALRSGNFKDKNGRPLNVGLGFAGGGYTGSGGKYQPAGTVHKGEFVMTKEATSALGVGNLYAIMRGATRGRSMRRGGSGFANGGFAGGSGTTVTELSAYDRKLLARLGDIALYIGNDQIAAAANKTSTTTSRRGTR